jgi:hypothetical protein
MSADFRSGAQRRRDTEHRLTQTSMSGWSTRTDTPSPALHVADSHDLVRVQGARENNLQDVSVEIPKRLADEQRASETASDRLLLLGKAATPSTWSRCCLARSSTSSSNAHARTLGAASALGVGRECRRELRCRDRAEARRRHAVRLRLARRRRAARPSRRGRCRPRPA